MAANDGKLRGYIMPAAEATGDRKVVAKLKAAQAKAGMATGPRFSANGEHVVSATFYPRTTFWLQKVSSDRGSYGEPRIIEKDEYDAMWTLRL
jgi:hypothetical protein